MISKIVIIRFKYFYDVTINYCLDGVICFFTVTVQNT